MTISEQPPTATASATIVDFDDSSPSRTTHDDEGGIAMTAYPTTTTASSSGVPTATMCSTSTQFQNNNQQHDNNGVLIATNNNNSNNNPYNNYSSGPAMNNIHNWDPQAQQQPYPEQQYPQSNNPYYNEAGIPIWEQPRQGATCCGCCCDFRRAVIILSSVLIGTGAFTLFSLIQSSEITPADVQTLVDPSGTVTIDDDEVVQEVADVFSDALLVNSILGGVVMILTCVPLYGAYTFRIPYIMFGVVLLVATYIARLLVAYFTVDQADEVIAQTGNMRFAQPSVLYTAYGVVMALFVYPHIGLIMEIKAGIMSLETYPREDYSCCCQTRYHANPQAPVLASDAMIQQTPSNTAIAQPVPPRPSAAAAGAPQGGVSCG